MKKSTLLSLLIFVLVFTLPGITYCQERIIKGAVTTFDSIPLIGATVKVYSSGIHTLTDTTGYFEINCLAKDKIKVKAYGFGSEKVRINEKTKIVLVNLTLKPSPKSKEIAVGYGHVKDRDKLYAISSLHSDVDEFSGYSNMLDLLEGRLPGVEVVGQQIIVRGTNSLNGSSAALIVVDGNIEDNSVLGMILPANVKSVSVLKDGSASIYGTRGASGVVLIETKRGGD